MPDKIDSFHGEHRFLSNFWPCRVMLKGEFYHSVEAAYQASKTTDLEARRPFQIANAKEAKSLGKRLALREDWDDVRLPVMEGLLRQKFSPGGELAQRLLDTGDAELIEGNWWGDQFLGRLRRARHEPPRSPADEDSRRAARHLRPDRAVPDRMEGQNPWIRLTWATG
jgi:hypothetical protein